MCSLLWMTLVIVSMAINCQTNDVPSVWCPKQLQVKATKFDTYTYSHCGPDECFNVTQHKSNSNLCPDDNNNLKSLMTSESCHWVRLIKDQHFTLDVNDGSIHEMKTNLTYKLGHYVYLQHLEEAIICRGHALPDDDTENITLWCSSHKIYIDEPLQIQHDGSLYIPQLNLTIDKDFYNVHNDDHKVYKSHVDVCLSFDLEFLRCEKFPVVDKVLEIQPNLSVQWDEGHEHHSVGHYYMSTDLNSVIICDIVEQKFHFADYLYILYIISAVFLLLALLAHLFYPTLNYHTKALLCHIISMMIMYICMAVNTFHYYVEAKFVRFLYFGINYVSSMATYLWLSVIAYELWKAFAKLRVPCGVLGTQMAKRRWFVMKCLYAWGIPLLLCVLVIGLSHDDSAARDLDLRLVTIGASYFDTRTSMFVFFYGPIALILAVNLMFFGLTVWNIRTATRITATLNENMNKQPLYLCVKLFVVMGLSWVADVIYFMVDRYKEGFYWSQVITGLQGVAIFLVYVCKASTWLMVKRKCGYADHATIETKCTQTGRSRMTLVDTEI